MWHRWVVIDVWARVGYIEVYIYDEHASVDVPPQTICKKSARPRMKSLLVLSVLKSARQAGGRPATGRLTRQEILY